MLSAGDKVTFKTGYKVYTSNTALTPAYSGNAEVQEFIIIDSEATSLVMSGALMFILT